MRGRSIVSYRHVALFAHCEFHHLTENVICMIILYHYLHRVIMVSRKRSKGKESQEDGDRGRGESGYAGGTE